MGDVQFGKDIVQAANFYPHSVYWLGRSRRPQAVASVVESLHDMEFRFAWIFARCAGNQRNIGGAVEPEMFFEPDTFPRRRLNGNNAAVPPDTL